MAMMPFQQAVNRATGRLDAVDVNGAFVWPLVREYIERLEAVKPAEGETVH